MHSSGSTNAEKLADLSLKSHVRVDFDGLLAAEVNFVSIVALNRVLSQSLSMLIVDIDSYPRCNKLKRTTLVRT